MGTISRGWALTGQSWEVLKRDRSLVIFPILSTIFAIVAAAVICTPALIIRGVFSGQPFDQHDPVMYAAGAQRQSPTTTEMTPITIAQPQPNWLAALNMDAIN